MLLPDDLIDDARRAARRMLDVQAERGGIVLGLMQVPGEDISKYGCVAPIGCRYDKDVVAVSDLVEKPSLARRAERPGDHRPVRAAAGDLRRAARDHAGRGR